MGIHSFYAEGMTDSYVINKSITSIVIDDIESSDHRALVHVFGDLSKPERINLPRYNIKNAKWSKFKSFINEKITNMNLIKRELCNNRHVKEYAIVVTDAIKDAAAFAIKKEEVLPKIGPLVGQ